MSKRVLVTEPIIPAVIDKLRNHFTVEVGKRGDYNSQKALIQHIGEYDGMLSMLSNPITENVLAAGERLQIVANHAVGYNNIDLKAAKHHNIHIANTPGVLSDSCAEFTIALMLAVARRLFSAQQYLLDGEYEGWEPLGFLGMELQGSTVGIIGMGRIGQAVARRAGALGMEVLYHNRNQVPQETETKLQATYISSVEEIAQQADVLTLHCPLSKETEHLIDQSILSLMPEHAILINTSRGPVVDEEALADALHSAKIGGAGIDVFEREPKVHPQLQSAPNCLLTPHIASASQKTRRDIGMLAASAIIDLLQGKKPSDIPNLIRA